MENLKAPVSGAKSIYIPFDALNNVVNQALNANSGSGTVTVVAAPKTTRKNWLENNVFNFVIIGVLMVVLLFLLLLLIRTETIAYILDSVVIWPEDEKSEHI